MNRHAPIVRVARGSAPLASMPGSRLSRALPEAERRYFESTLQHDFSGVRLHTGTAAAQAAAARGAHAFTDGSDIAFGAGRYQPGTAAGRNLLAHELTHVAQQDRGGDAGSAPAGAEARARQSGSRAVLGDTVAVADQGGAGAGVQCDDDEKALPPASAPATALPPLGQLTLPKLGDSLPTFGASRLGAPRLGDSLHAPFGGGLTPPTLSPPLNLLPPLTLPPLGPVRDPAGVGGKALGPLRAPDLPGGPTDRAALLAPFALHGVAPGQFHLDMNQDLAAATGKFSYLGPGLAKTLGEMALGSAYQQWMARDFPSQLDLENRRWKEANPNESAIPPLPLFSSSTLTKAFEWITNSKNTDKFYF